MNRFGTLAYYMLLSVAAVPAGSAQGLSVDWKFYGGASIQGKSQFCLKRRALLKRLTVTYEFGQKCLPQTALDNIDTKTELGDRIVQDPNRSFELTRRGARTGRSSTASFDDFVGPREQRLRDGKAERLRGLEVDYQLEPGRLLCRQIGRLGALEDLVHEHRSLAIEIRLQAL